MEIREVFQSNSQVCITWTRFYVIVTKQDLYLLRVIEKKKTRVYEQINVNSEEFPEEVRS